MIMPRAQAHGINTASRVLCYSAHEHGIIPKNVADPFLKVEGSFLMCSKICLLLPHASKNETASFSWVQKAYLMGLMGALSCWDLRDLGCGVSVEVAARCMWFVGVDTADQGDDIHHHFLQPMLATSRPSQRQV